MNTKLIFAIFFTAVIYGKINAQIITDRPDQTESSSTVPKGALQLESGVLVGFEGDDLFSKRQILLPTNLFRYGLIKGIELRILNQVELINYRNQNNQGISDLEIGTKIQLKQNKNNTEIAFLTHLIIPTGTKELTSDNFGSINKLCLSHSVNENINVGYNVGYNYFGEGSGDLTYSLALGIGITEKVAIYIEPYGELENMNDYISNFDLGFTCLANENLQFDFSFGSGMNQRMNYVSIGCSWLIIKG